MDAVLNSFISGFPVLLLHYAVTVAMLVAGVALYLRLTPVDEIALAREGNLAAAISTAGIIVSVGLPLAVCMSASVNVYDILIWGTVTILIQLTSFRIADRLLPDLPRRIEAGEVGSALVLVSVKFTLALVNAAAVSG